MTSDESISVVIPSLTSSPMTLESVPSEIETAVVQEGNRAEARNLGVERTSGEIIVFCDDDIEFAESFFWEEAGRARDEIVAGLEDFDFGLLLTRFMTVCRSTFDRIGGFDERLNHMEDTEFCLKALSKGVQLRRIDRSALYHEQHESAGQGRLPTFRNTIRLCIQYPKFAPRLLRGVLL